MSKNHNRKTIRREFHFLKIQKLRLMMKMEIINRGSKLKSQEVGEDSKINILNKTQVKGKSDMFRSRKMHLKVPNLNKKDINSLKKVLINNKRLINLIVGVRIEVDNNNVVAMKVVVEAIKIVSVVIHNSKIIGK